MALLLLFFFTYNYIFITFLTREKKKSNQVTLCIGFINEFNNF